MGALSGYNLSPNQLRDLHNAGCYFHSFIERYRDVLGKQVIEDFERPWNLFLNVRKKILEVESKSFDKKFNYYDSIRKQNNFMSIWSLYEVDDINAHSHVVGATELRYEDKKIDLDPNHHYTWFELWSCADKIMQETDDRHHIFIELFKLNGAIVELWCGS